MVPVEAELLCLACMNVMGFDQRAEIFMRASIPFLSLTERPERAKEGVICNFFQLTFFSPLSSEIDFNPGNQNLMIYCLLF